MLFSATSSILSKSARLSVAVLLLCSLIFAADTNQNSAKTQTEPYQIGIWYFTAWSRTNNDVQPVAAASAYGRWDPWGGIRDFVLDTKGFPEYQHVTNLKKFPPDYWLVREPLVGFYDDVDQSIMDAHIQEAASHGITYFAFYWYWYPTKEEVFFQKTKIEPGLDLPLKLFLNSKYKNLMKFALAPIMLGSDASSNVFVSPDLIEKYVYPQLINYMSDSAYLRDADGRPILFNFNEFGFLDPIPTPQNHLYICSDTCSLSACTKEAHERSKDPDVVPFVTNFCTYGRSLNTLRSQAMASGLPNPDILYIAPAGYLDILYNVDPAANGIGIQQDGAACFVLGPNQTQTYDDTAAHFKVAWQWQSPPNAQLATYIPCATTGLDDRDWLYADGYLPHDTDLDPSIFQPEGSSRFESHLEDAKAFMDSHPSTHGFMTLYAFNEWGEGGTCEPSAVLGYACLDDVQRVFGLLPNGSEPNLSASRANFVSQSISVTPFVLAGSKAECDPYRKLGIPTIDCPLSLKPGTAASFSVTFQNTGTDPWNTVSQVLLAQPPNNPQFTLDAAQPLPNLTIVPNQSQVAPGGRVMYTLSVQAPQTPGRYRLEVRLQNGDEWFGDFTPLIPILVMP